MVIFCFAIRNNLGNDTNNRWKEYFRWKNFGTSLDLKKFNLWFIICLFAAIQTLFFVLCTIGLHLTLRLDTRCILILNPPTTLRRTRHCHVTVPKIIFIYSECGLHQAKNLLPLRRRLLGQGNEIVTLGFNLLLHEGGRHFPCTTLPTPPLPFSGSFMVFIEKRDIATRCLRIMSRRLKLDIRIKSEIGGEGGAVGSSVQTEKE